MRFSAFAGCLVSLCLSLALLRPLPGGAEESPMNSPAGVLDTSFDAGSGPVFGTPSGTRLGSILTVVPLPDGKVVVGGFWDRFNGQPNASLARLTASGALDPSFAPELTNYFPALSNLHVRAVVRQPDGKLVVSWLGGIDRLEPDGRLDPSVHLAFVFAAELVLQPDGKILAAGPGLMRLHAEGDIDTEFAQGRERWEGEAKGILLQRDGKIVFVGDLVYEEDGVLRHVSPSGLGRLNPDGTPDDSFAPPVQYADASSIYTTAVQADDKIVLGGAFVRLGTFSNLYGVARLEPDGALDATFRSGLGVRTIVRMGDVEYSVDGAVFGIEALPYGKLMVGGSFATFDDLSRTNLARLNADGSVDLTFGAGAMSPDGVVDHIKPVADEKYLISGTFTNVGGILRPRLARMTGLAVEPPMITQQPTDLTVVLGSVADFTISATTFTSVAWLFNGQPLPIRKPPGKFSLASTSTVEPPNVLDADTTHLRVVGATPANQGAYSCVVTSPGGSVTSAVAQLTVVAALSLSVNGSGTVVPSVTGTTFALGTSLMFTATPAAGWLFSGWRAGGEVVTSSKITVVLTSNLTLVANFVANPFVAAQGTFNGLAFEPSEPSHERAGFLTLRLAASGAYSGSILFGGQKLTGSGVFDSRGDSTAQLRGETPAGGASWRLKLMPGGTVITGTVSDAAGSVPLEMRREAYGKKLPSTGLTALYTFLVQPSAGTGLTIGDGFGNLGVDGSGNLVMTATLADGSSVVQKVGLAEGGDWPLFALLSGGRGSIFGWAKINPSAANALVAARPLHWTRPAQAKPPYTGGFTNDFVLLGSPASPSMAGRLLSLTNAVTILAGGDLLSTVTNDVRLELKYKVINLSTNALKLTVVPAKTQFKGTVAVPNARKPVAVQGVFLPRQNFGGGFFRGSNVTGQVYLGP